jgi:LPS export ABC transporter permease LptG
VLDYYKFKSFTILYQIAPIISLVTTLVAFGLLSRTNEITAFKSSGISLYRLAVPVILVSLGIACVSGWLQAEVLPAANSRVAELEAVIMNRKTTHLQRADRRWLYGRGDDGASHYLYNYLSFDDKKNELFRLQVFKFDAEFRLTDRLLANRAIYAGDGWWTFADGWSRSFAGNRHTSYRRFPESVRDRLPETPAFFQGELRQPTEMTYRELRQYVQELREIGGQEQLPQLEVALHNKIAYPAISLVMALVALPFAFRLERKGALYGIGLSLVLGIVLMGFVALFNALGLATILPPVVAVWSPSILFAIFSLYLFLGVRT